MTGKLGHDLLYAAVVEVHEASLADADVVADLVVRFFRDEGFATPADHLRSRVEPFLSDPDNTVLLARSGGTAVGIATITTAFGFEVGRYAEVEDLYVLPDYRRHGWATKLIDSAADWARAHGCAELEVVVTPEGEVAHDLVGYYHARGFAATGRHILVRRLAPPDELL